MAAPGFSRSRTKAFDIPMADMDLELALLKFHENGDREGIRRAYSTEGMKAKVLRGKARTVSHRPPFSTC
jgi:hypothetical protein